MPFVKSLIFMQYMFIHMISVFENFLDIALYTVRHFPIA